MRVLVGCESSGTVRRAFQALGHQAWSCDILPADDGETHYHLQDDLLGVLRRHQGFFDLGIFHPPCTFLSVSGQHWAKTRPERVAKTLEALAFVRALMACGIPKIALENPVGVISTSDVGKPTQIIQPYEYGEDASKRTCLWLRGLKPLVGTKYVEPRKVEYRGKICNRWANQTDSGQNKLPPSEDRWQLRSKTYDGIAHAMAAQWGGQCQTPVVFPVQQPTRNEDEEMAKSRAELLAEIAGSTPSGGGNNLRDGRYRFVVKKLSLPPPGFHGPRWDMDLVIKHASKVPVFSVAEATLGKPVDVEPNAVGTDVGIVKMLTTKEPYAAPGLGDTKAFVLALYDADPNTSAADLIETLDELDAKNSAYGMMIDCVTRRKLSVKNQVEMVLQDWTHVVQTKEEILANRKWIESLTLVPAALPATTNPTAVEPAVAGALGPPKLGAPKALGPPSGPPSA